MLNIRVISILFFIFVFFLSGCATQVMTDSIAINHGSTKNDVLNIMGPPNDRQFQGKDEAWQYCNTGFVNDSFVVVWFHDGKVTGTNSYKDSVGNIGFCDSHIRTINWEDKPNISIEIRSR